MGCGTRKRSSVPYRVKVAPIGNGLGLKKATWKWTRRGVVCKVPALSWRIPALSSSQWGPELNPERAFPSELWHGVWLRPASLLQVPHAHSKPGLGLGLGESTVPSQTGDHAPHWLLNPSHFTHVTLMGPEFPGRAWSSLRS